ncbi:hypothetical protein COT97_02815 [Candidatus Falkowbacteria bacterium CG10_big_fil_rev_8_21_14_0_10_39_11]|uniref:Uncharacterized protein n=1 Tax=Candidatus Falkowbacteria bacterium CG10_big_fil_rev_8_21_14_0_10_39_11 TaxID=1974565 RepID=A0A2H0V4Y5_9BACT|nr:MAG: hypothetical protein COT97_02815 [Candidatus Falkowbacteria bacterium CG10_big_fil_rev_8_21_14_0_10_39_11]
MDVIPNNHKVVQVGSFNYRVYNKGIGIWCVVDVNEDSWHSNCGEAPEVFVARCLELGKILVPETFNQPQRKD